MDTINLCKLHKQSCISFLVFNAYHFYLPSIKGFAADEQNSMGAINYYGEFDFHVINIF